MVPCQPQGRIPEIRIPHTVEQAFYTMAVHFCAVTVAVFEIGPLKCFIDSHWQMLSFMLTLTHIFEILLSVFYEFIYILLILYKSPGRL